MGKWICTICKHTFESEGSPDGCEKCQAEIRSILSAENSDEAQISGLPEDLEEVRNRARLKLKGICAVYPACDGRPDKICQKEAYGKPIGFGGAGSGAGFTANVTSLARLNLKTRLVGNHFEPDTAVDFLGLDLSLPVLGAPTSGIEKYNNVLNEYDFCRMNIKGCLEAGTMSFRGDTWFYTLENNPALDALEEEGGRGIPIFKPRAQDILKRFIARAEKAGCPAVGIDLDGCGSTIMAGHGQPVFRKSVKELKELVSCTSLPFIVKGIMTPEDAEDCVSAGVKIVAVSNHGGRVLDSTPGVAKVLPEIADRVGKYATITADGGVRTGYDVLKMLALGADAVLIGRDLIRAAVGGGTEGVRLQMERSRQTLRQAMMMTRCRSVAEINRDVFC
jgi:isopentenyl diphosphate isomerase/L-lactate dehydrogenase-like FMN-dependent dehydrogenase